MEKLTSLTFAKTHFSALIDQVEQGEEFVVTRMGRPISQTCLAGRPARF